MKIAIQGEAGSFSHEVAQKLFGRITLLPCETFTELFEARADAAIVPMENALFGSIHQNFDLLVKHHPSIWGEAFHRIELCLIGLDKQKPKKGQRVLSHPVAAGQCGTFLRSHGLQLEMAHDTAGSVRRLTQERPANTYAIASALAAKLYGAHVVHRGIEDDPRNFTRFLAVSRKKKTPLQGKQWKTSLAFVLPNRPSALFRALGAFSLRDVDLAKLESRPMAGRPFEYLFYLDAMGSMQEPRVKNAVAHLKEMTESLWLLGSYPSVT